jgi:hypothetical protein
MYLNRPEFPPIELGPTNAAAIVEVDSEYEPSAPTVQDGELRFAFELAAVFDDYTYIDMAIWKQNPMQTGSYLNYQAVSHRRHHLTAGTYQWFPVDHDFDGGSVWDSTRPAYYTEFRFVKEHPETGQILARSRYYVGGFTLRNSNPSAPSSYSYLTDMGVGPRIDLKDNTFLETTVTSSERTVVGAFVPLSALPPFAPGTTPVRGERPLSWPTASYTPPSSGN